MSDQNPGKSGLRSRRAGDRKLTPRSGMGTAMWYVLAVFLLLALGQAFYFMQGGETISYSDFKQRVRDGSVQEVTVAEDRVHGVMKGGPKGTHPFMAVRIEDPKLHRGSRTRGHQVHG